MKRPIFIGITRSFWLAVSGFVIFVGAGEPAVHGAATLFCIGFGWVMRTCSPDATTRTLMDVAPLVLFLAALQQRSGAARPYTVKATRETLK
jgi:hypothetical protein